MDTGDPVASKNYCARVYEWLSEWLKSATEGSQPRQFTHFLRARGLGWRAFNAFRRQYPPLDDLFDKATASLHADWVDYAFSRRGKNMSPGELKAFTKYLNEYDDYGRSLKEREAKVTVLPTAFSCKDMEIDERFVKIAEAQNQPRERDDESMGFDGF